MNRSLPTAHPSPTPDSPTRAGHLAAVVLLAVGVQTTTASARTDRPPNVVLIFADDLAYADLGCYGAEGYETPHLDRMAREGTRFTDFYVAQPVCSASRAALLTGCYPNRIGIGGALGPGAKHGLHPEETTLAELCRARGYATAILGKWHLGHRAPHLPMRHGFDEYYGIPYSNDMWPHHPESPDAWGDLPTMSGADIVGYNTDQREFTLGFTDRAIDFIERHRDRPFFVYLAHPMPHVPLHVSEAFRAKTGRGLFGDVIAEIDESAGRILDALRRLDLDDDTLVIFTSDNGPWLSYGDHAGSAAPLREGKGTTFDGGVRVPCIMRWPARIPGRGRRPRAGDDDRRPADDRAPHRRAAPAPADRRPRHLADHRRRGRGALAPRGALLLLPLQSPGGDAERALEAPLPASLSHDDRPRAGTRRHPREVRPPEDRSRALRPGGRRRRARRRVGRSSARGRAPRRRWPTRYGSSSATS